MYVVPSELQPPVHPMMLRLPSTLNSTTIDGPLTRRCSPDESSYELAAKASWTGENEGGDVVVVLRPVDAVGTVADVVVRTVVGDVLAGARDDELAHDEHVSATMIKIAGNRTMCRRSEIRPRFHCLACDRPDLSIAIWTWRRESGSVRACRGPG